MGAGKEEGEESGGVSTVTSLRPIGKSCSGDKRPEMGNASSREVSDAKVVIRNSIEFRPYSVWIRPLQLSTDEKWECNGQVRGNGRS